MLTNPIQDEGRDGGGRRGQIGLPTSFPHLTSTNLGISRQYFYLTFKFNPF